MFIYVIIFPGKFSVIGSYNKTTYTYQTLCITIPFSKFVYIDHCVYNMNKTNEIYNTVHVSIYSLTAQLNSCNVGFFNKCPND